MAYYDALIAAWNSATQPPAGVTGAPLQAGDTTQGKIDKINAADSMIFQTEKQLKEYGDKIPADKKSPIEAALEKLKTAHKSQDVGAIETAMNEINTAWQAASEDMYKASQEAQQQSNSAGTSDQQSAQGDNDTTATDVDFEEVK